MIKFRDLQIGDVIRDEQGIEFDVRYVRHLDNNKEETLIEVIPVIYGTGAERLVVRPNGENIMVERKAAAF